MWSKGNTHLLLVEVQTHSETLDIRMAVSQKNGNQSSTRPNNTTLWHIPKDCTLVPQGRFLNYVHSSIIHNSQNLETT